MKPVKDSTIKGVALSLKDGRNFFFKWDDLSDVMKYSFKLMLEDESYEKVALIESQSSYAVGPLPDFFGEIPTGYTCTLMHYDSVKEHIPKEKNEISFDQMLNLIKESQSLSHLIIPGISKPTLVLYEASSYWAKCICRILNNKKINAQVIDVHEDVSDLVEEGPMLVIRNNYNSLNYRDQVGAVYVNPKYINAFLDDLQKFCTDSGDWPVIKPHNYKLYRF